MNPDTRAPVARYLAAARPITPEGWVETRRALKWQGHLFLVEDHWPEWTSRHVYEFAREMPDAEIVTIEVRIKPADDEKEE